MIDYRCPSCRHEFAAPDWLNASVKCTHCGIAVTHSDRVASQTQTPGENLLVTFYGWARSRLRTTNVRPRATLFAIPLGVCLLLMIVLLVRYSMTSKKFEQSVAVAPNGGERLPEEPSGGVLEILPNGVFGLPRQNETTIPLTREAIYKKSLRSTVWIFCILKDERFYTGAGSVIDHGRRLVLTNNHIIRDAERIYVYAPLYKSNGDVIPNHMHYLDNAEETLAHVIAKDSARDLALLKLSEPLSGASAIAFSSGSARPGQNVHTIGNSGVEKEGGLWVYTSGTVRQVYEKQLRSDAGLLLKIKIIETQNPINFGDSGGPVVNDDGELIAVTTAFSENARLVSYCVDIDEVREFLRELQYRP